MYASLSLSVFPAGDRAVQAFGLSSGTCGLRMSLFLLESPPPSPSVRLSTSGAPSHLHRRQTQVGLPLLSELCVDLPDLEVTHPVLAAVF